MLHKPLLILLILIYLTQSIQKIQKINSYQKRPVPIPQYNQTQHTFNQITDHFDYTSKIFWKQRYWSVNNFFNKRYGPVFLYICGQYVCPGVPQTRKWAIVLANRTQGLVLVLQHRYYGESMPYGNKSLNTQNLRNLNTQQALRDLAYFIMQVKKSNLYGVTDNPWITIGGSYPGALSAWFRYKYPHLAIGAIASSAVINVIQDYQQYDEQVYLSLGKSGFQCATAIQNIDTYVQNIILSDQGFQFKKKFGAQFLTDIQFFYFWSDIPSGFVQYGQRINFCKNFLNKTFDQQLNYAISIALQNDPRGYSTAYLSNPQYFDQFAQQRAWTYQFCTQFGFFQTASMKHSARSKYITVQTYRQWCKNIFGDQIIAYANRSNYEFGGLNLKASNIYMVNGGEDPWKWAGYPRSQGNIISVVADCNDCAHCAQLYTPSSQDSEILTKIRDRQYLTVLKWIDDYYGDKSNKKMLQWIKKLLSYV